MIAVADHFEPSIVPEASETYAGPDEQGRRVDRWCREYPRAVEPWRDADVPLARGRTSFIRKVDPKGLIEINGKEYFVGKRLTGRYVTARIFPHRQELVVKRASRPQALPVPDL